MPGGKSTSQERTAINIIKRNIDNVKANSQKSIRSQVSSQNSNSYVKMYKEGKNTRRSQSQKRAELDQIVEVVETKENQQPNPEIKIEVIDQVLDGNLISQVSEELPLETIQESHSENILSPCPLDAIKSPLSKSLLLSEKKRLSLNAPKISVVSPINEEEEEPNLKRKRISADGAIETNDVEHSAKKPKLNE